eukprot:702011-Hanusia_phi.AAC.1
MPEVVSGRTGTSPIFLYAIAAQTNTVARLARLDPKEWEAYRNDGRAKLGETAIGPRNSITLHKKTNSAEAALP